MLQIVQKQAILYWDGLGENQKLLYACIAVMVIEYILQILLAIKYKTISFRMAGHMLIRKLAIVAVILITFLAGFAWPLLEDFLPPELSIVKTAWVALTAWYAFREVCFSLVAADELGGNVLPESVRKILDYFLGNE